MACCRGGRPEVSVGRRRQAYLRAARRVRGHGGVGAGEGSLESRLQVPPHEIFASVDAPDSEYEQRAANAEKYRVYAR